MRVAFTTSDMKNVNAHFAGAKTIAVYDVSQDDSRFIEALQFDNASAQEGAHGDDGEERINARIRSLAGVALLFVKAIGGPAAAKVVRANVHPIKLPKEEPIAEVIERVQGMMKGNPPPWLRKIMMETGGTVDAMAFMDEDE
jgi:nitrogen fixation protein NifX